MTRDDISKLIQECGFSGITENDYLYFWKFYKKAYEAGAKAEQLSNTLQKDFWEACKPYGKVGECIFLTYKIQKKRSAK